jgi:hypothetical protein
MDSRASVPEDFIAGKADRVEELLAHTDPATTDPSRWT